MEIAGFYIYGTGREYQDVKINIDMSTIEINGEWYILVTPNDDNYVVADVKDSVGTKISGSRK